MIRFKGKVAVITGASKGIGRACAEQIAAEGGRVVVSSRKQEAVDAVAEEIRKNDGEAIAFQCKAGIAEDMENLITKTTEEWGRVDILINNAAANPVYGLVIETPDSAIDKIMEVNLKAPFHFSRLAYPHFKKQGGGSIVNISSVGGLSPEKFLGMYSVSKAALNMLSKVMAEEFGGDNIRVNAVCPGLIKTDFSKALWENEQMLKHWNRQTPLGRPGTVEEVAAMVCFLASDESRFITGGVFPADGGFTI